jgi:hypothetical protein
MFLKKNKENFLIIAKRHPFIRNEWRKSPVFINLMMRGVIMRSFITVITIFSLLMVSCASGTSAFNPSDPSTPSVAGAMRGAPEWVNSVPKGCSVGSYNYDVGAMDYVPGYFDDVRAEAADSGRAELARTLSSVVESGSDRAMRDLGGRKQREAQSAAHRMQLRWSRARLENAHASEFWFSENANVVFAKVCFTQSILDEFVKESGEMSPELQKHIIDVANESLGYRMDHIKRRTLED